MQPPICNKYVVEGAEKFTNCCDNGVCRFPDTLIEETAQIMSDAVHDNKWDVLKKVSPFTADAELRRAKAIVEAQSSEISEADIEECLIMALEVYGGNHTHREQIAHKVRMRSVVRALAKELTLPMREISNEV